MKLLLVRALAAIIAVLGTNLLVRGVYAEVREFTELSAGDYIESLAAVGDRSFPITCWSNTVRGKRIPGVVYQTRAGKKWRSIRSLRMLSWRMRYRILGQRIRVGVLQRAGRVSCESASPSPTQSPTAAPTVRAPSPSPSLSPSLVPTATPSATPLPSPTPSPSGSSTPIPTGTPSSTATPLPTAQTTPSPTPTAAPTASSLQLVITTNRTSGPAPLAVAFDATGTVGLAGDDYVGATFLWNFGDDDNERWASSGKRTNRSTGFVTGHVYKNPGNYTARVRVIDRAGNRSAEQTIPITVQHPGTVYTATFCVSAGGTDASCAPGATALGSFNQMIAQMGPNRRFLIRRNYQETVPQSVAIRNISGPVYIGAYGDGAAPQITFPTTHVESAFAITGTTGMTIEDVMLVGPDAPHNNGAPVGIWLDGVNTLFHRLQIRGFSRNIHLAGHGGSPLRHGNFIVSSALIDSGYFSLTNSSNFRLTTVLGNYFSDSVQGHIRVLESQKTFIGHNMFVGAFGVKSHSGAMVVADNVFDGGTYARVAYGTGGGGEPCNIPSKMHHLVDGNIFLGVSPTYSGGVGGVIIECGGNFVVRSNAFLNVHGAVTVSADRFESGFGGSLPVRVYNNYSADDGPSNRASTFLNISPGYPRIDVRNNLVYFPTLNFYDGSYTTALSVGSADISNLSVNNNIWYLPASSGSNGATPGLFARTGSYPNHIGYSSTITSPATVQYFGSIRPLSEWRGLGFDTLTQFVNPGALVFGGLGLLTLPSQSPAFAAGDPSVPFFVDIYGRERGAGTPMPIGPFLPE